MQMRIRQIILALPLLLRLCRYSLRRVWCYDGNRYAAPLGRSRQRAASLGSHGRAALIGVAAYHGGNALMRALKFALALGAVAVAASASPSQAVTIVIGGGLATECYATAEFGDAFTAYDICTRAL